MKIVIGIDVGISTTKIVGIRDGKVIKPLRVKATTLSLLFMELSVSIFTITR